MSTFLFGSSNNSSTTALSALTWDQLQLNIEDGGIGIGVTDHLRFVSFLASFVQCSSALFDHHRRVYPAFDTTSILVDYSTTDAQYHDFCQHLANCPEPSSASLTQIHTWQLQYVSHAFCISNPILHSLYYCLYGINKQNFAISTLFNLHSNDRKLQANLSAHMYSIFATNFFTKVASSVDLGYIAHIGSLRNADSGRWLVLSPKFPSYIMTSTEFRISLLRRCYLPQPSITAGLRCNCSSHPIIDTQGRHFTTGCAKGQHRIEAHDQVKNAIAQLCRYSGCAIRMEEKNCFAQVTIDDDPNHDGRRPDLSVLNSKNSNNKKELLMDISITQSYPGSKSCTVPSTFFSKSQATNFFVARSSTTGYYPKNQQISTDF